MDLLSAIFSAKEAIGHLRSGPGMETPWATDADEFFRHFGVSVEEFVELISMLSPDQLALYERTLQVNPEAAVLWILAMDVIG